MSFRHKDAFGAIFSKVGFSLARSSIGVGVTVGRGHNTQTRSHTYGQFRLNLAACVWAVGENPPPKEH